MVDDVTACRPNQFSPFPTTSAWLSDFYPAFTQNIYSCFIEVRRLGNEKTMTGFLLCHQNALLLLILLIQSLMMTLAFLSRPTHVTKHVTKLHALNSFPSLPVWLYDWNNHPSPPFSLSIQFHFYSPTKDQHFAKRIPVSYFISLMTWESEWGSVRLESVCKKYDTSHTITIMRGAFLFFHFLRPNDSRNFL